MTLVRLVANYQLPLARLSPGGLGQWDGIEFTTEPVQRCDYLVSFNYPPDPVQTVCPREHCWAIAQEPPTCTHAWLHVSHPSFSRIYSCDGWLRGHHRVLSYPALGWHLDRDWDWLSAAKPPTKNRLLSTVTSDLSWLGGHRRRLSFLQGLQDEVPFEWWGRGVRDLEDKWDGLADFHYSLAFENYVSPHYWTEKLVDCLLAWTVPIYCGCPKIETYFPARALVRVDLSRPAEARRIVQSTVEREPDAQTQEALHRAREMVLNHYHPLAFVARLVREHERQGCCCRPALQKISPRVFSPSLMGRLSFLGRRGIEAVTRRPLPW